MDNQLLTNQAWIQQVAVAIVVILLASLLAILGIHQFQHSDPYVQSVLLLQGNSIQGQAIFQMNCAGCHGMQADGRVGPSLRGIGDRKSRPSLIHQVISGETPPMPQFQPTSQEMADLLSYLESL